MNRARTRTPRRRQIMLSAADRATLAEIIYRAEAATDDLPNLLGGAFGAAWCDRAHKLWFNVSEIRLLLDLPDRGAHDAAALNARDERGEFRRRIGLPPAPHRNRRRCLPLEAAEHRALAVDLKRLQRDLASAFVIVGNGFPARSGIRKRAKRALRLNLGLRGALDRIAIDRGLGAAVYFGRLPEEVP